MPNAALLQALLPNVPLLLKEETGSTNADAKDWLTHGAPSGGLCIADRQIAGRGRLGRSFCSELGGLYMSVLLEPTLRPGQLTTLCAVAVCRAVRELSGTELTIKWVNDLFYEGKKVCGILCESVWSGGNALGVVAGIGLNLCQADFPADVSNVAVALFPNGKAPAPSEAFAAAIYRQIFALLPNVPSHMTEYRTRCFTLRQQVQWRQDGLLRSGKAAAIADDGALIVETADGSVALTAGEVSVRTVS